MSLVLHRIHPPPPPPPPPPLTADLAEKVVAEEGEAGSVGEDPKAEVGVDGDGDLALYAGHVGEGFTGERPELVETLRADEAAAVSEEPGRGNTEAEDRGREERRREEKRGEERGMGIKIVCELTRPLGMAPTRYTHYTLQ